MLSLMFSAIKYAFGRNYAIAENSPKDINDIIACIENTEISDEYIPNGTKENKNEDEYCYREIGYVTLIADDHIVIDNSYMCKDINISVTDLKVGDKVSYLAFQGDNEKERKIYKITSTVEESWDDEVNKSNVLSVKQHTLRRSVIGKVTKRNCRRVFVQPNDITVDLDKVQSEFIPIIGDWLKLECLVELNEDSIDFSGEILEVKRIQSLRSKLDVGSITNYDVQTGVGVIEKNIIFTRNTCASGYVPNIGDKVVSDSIESEQGFYSWRSLSVVPLVQVLPENANLGKTQTHKNLDILLKNKHGITITEDLKFNLKMNEEKELVVSIQNTSSNIHVLQKSCFVSKKAESQLTLAWPSTDKSTTLNSCEGISYIFKCKGKFIGTSEELFIFYFQGFKIGRIFNISVSPLHNASSKNPEHSRKIESYNQKREKWRYDTNEDQMMYIPGVRACKPPAFIKVRNGIFKVPPQFWNAVLDPLKENKSQLEREVALGDAIPCLLKGLTFSNYKDRFHALLYLEEIAQTLDIQQYDMENVVMKHSGDYLVLEVNGLAEKRPSLLIGDKAIVSFDWDSSGGKIKYEGCIHKVTNKEVFLKFNQMFHYNYNSEQCRVTFKCSQSVIQRCHNAVNLAVTRLGPKFLFPMCVIEKEPQLNLEDVVIEGNSFHARANHKRNESISSACSSISIASGGSCDGTVKSPRVSVVERLFNAKPIKRQSDIKKTSLSTQENKESTAIPNNQSSDGNLSKSKEKANNIGLEPYISQIKKRKLVWFNEKLNYYQKYAVKNILEGVARPLPYIIFGPPGTGKTVTLCEAILQILTTIPESRLLVATPSNSSANLVAERLIESGILKPGDLVRLLAYHCVTDESIPEKLLPYCATADLGDRKSREKCEYTETGLRMNCTMNLLGRHRITVGTCTSLGILHNIGFPRGHFSHVLIDEAGQATEPEIMIPLNFIHSDYGQVVLAGDPLQLGPVVQSKLAMHFGLGESFLARLLHHFPYQKDPESYETSYDSRLVTKLIMNYRSLPEILGLSDSLFYDSELLPQISSKKSKEAELLRSLASELPQRDGSPPAIVFHGVIGENLRDCESPSWYNPEEAAQVYLYLVKLYKHGLRKDDIGIITPYQKQVLQIRDLLLELDIEAPKICSVEGFQGQERNVIILSTVRSCDDFVNEDIRHALGFVASPKRLNVAITRARALLIIIGNPRLLGRDPYWRSVLMYCIDKKSYTGCNFIPSYIEDVFTDANDDILE